MLVRMTTHIGGYRNGEEWPPVGGTIDVPDHEADSLITAGYARPATEEDGHAADDEDLDASHAHGNDGAAAPGHPVATSDGQPAAGDDAHALSIRNTKAELQAAAAAAELDTSGTKAELLARLGVV